MFQGLKEKEHIPVTEAKTPNFALKSRAEKWKSDKLVSRIAGNINVSFLTSFIKLIKLVKIISNMPLKIFCVF